MAVLPSIPSQGGQVSGASRGECVWHSTRQEAAACPQPAPLQAQGTEECPPCQLGPAQHYTYCFLEAELSGRLPGFSSREGRGAEASAGRGL